MRPTRTVSIALALATAACAQLPQTSPEAAPPPLLAMVQNPPPAPMPAVVPPPSPTFALESVSPPPVEVVIPEPLLKPDMPPASLWTRVRGGFVMEPIDNSMVRDWENWYSSRPDYVARMIERSSRYLYHIIAEIERRKMPAEIALLPMIESAYNPVAYSRSHASGIWQFIPSTGKHYGLRQNWWYDGRRDIVAATNAALDYLEKLYQQFGSWDLALASYNWGEGAVSRAIAKNQAKGLPTDYQSLTMPAETRQYVPKLIAVKNIISDPAKYGLNLADIPNEPYFETVRVPRHIDLKVAAKLADMEIDEFKYLNPAHNKPVIKSDGSETMVLPRHKVSVFLANLAANEKPLVSWQAYTVKAGEKPDNIAARYGLTLTRLKEINGINGRKKISTGQPLLVPTNGSAEPNLPDLPATPVSLPKAVKAARYTNHGKGAVRKVSAKSGKKVLVKRAPGNRVRVVVRAKSPTPKKVVVAAKR